MSNQRNNQNRSWMVTLPADKFSKEQVEETLKPYTYIGQLEKGSKDGYLHWQIYIENKTQIRFQTLLNKLKGGHFEVRHSSKQACYDYVTKSKTAIPNSVIKNGEIDLKEVGSKKVNVEEVVGMMKRGMRVEEVLLEYPTMWRSMAYLERVDAILQKERLSRSERPLKVFYLYSEPGQGKSTYLMNKYGYDDTYRVTNYEHPFDSYTGEKVLILDEFYDSLPFGLLLTALEPLPFQMPARYNDKWAGYEVVWIVSNRKLEDQYTDIQEWESERFPAFARRISDSYTMVDRQLILDNAVLDKIVPPEGRQ